MHQSILVRSIRAFASQIRRQAERGEGRAAAGRAVVHVDRRAAARARAEPGAEREFKFQRPLLLSRERHARQRVRQEGYGYTRTIYSARRRPGLSGSGFGSTVLLFSCILHQYHFQGYTVFFSTREEK